MIDLEEMSLTDLKALAKEHNIKNISKLKKEELIAVLKQIINPSLEADKEDENNDLDTIIEEARKILKVTF